MSHVRRCDKCGNIFSELEVGWQTYTATTVIEDERTGEPREIKQAMDACPACAMVPRRQFARETSAALEGHELESRIAKLERETGLDHETGTFEEPDPEILKA